MKKLFKILSVAMLALSVSAFVNSCNRETQPAESGNVTFVISPEGVNAVTKATTTVITGSKEDHITDVVILAFRGGVLATAPVSATSGSVSMNLPYGEYDVWAVVNTGSLKSAAQWAAVSSPTAITNTAVAYAAYNDATDFVQVGHKTVTVNAASLSESVSTTRLVSRIRFQSIRNSMPSGIGTLTLQRIFLCNVAAGSVTLGGSVSSATYSSWANPLGRPASKVGTTTATIDGSTNVADNAALTYQNATNAIAVGATAGSSSSPLALFYPYPNANTGFSTAAWSSLTAMQAQATCVCVAGTVSANPGKTYYWTFDLPALECNKSYDVSLTITKLGTDTPGEMKEGTVSVTVTPAAWGAGSDVNEIL